MAVLVSAGNFGTELDCHKCSKLDQIEKGCNKDSIIPDVWQILDRGWSFQRCPLKVITGQSMDYIQAYALYLKGYLPNQGGWLEQPAKFIQAVMIIEQEVGMMRVKEQNKSVI